MLRPNGISTLIACQNEEATIGWCILSFLTLSDEIVVVDNGSTDKTKEICRNLSRRYSEKVRFFDKPELNDLSENRQFALEQSRFRWVVRADSDYICYTDGGNDASRFRQHLLSRPRGVFRPAIYWISQPNLYLDFWHTGDDYHCGDAGGRCVGGVRGRKRLPVIAPAMPRVYEYWSGFRFGRLGRTEGVKMGRIVRRLARQVTWPEPIWMHCSIKSHRNLLFRSERTNWRAHGDFDRYPTLKSFLQEKVMKEYGYGDLDRVAKLYVSEHVLPDVRPVSVSHGLEYPALVKRAMTEAPVYRIQDGSRGRVLKRVSEPWMGIE